MLLGGDTLNLGIGGFLPGPYQTKAGSTVNVQGGSIGDNFFCAGGTVNLYSGSIGKFANINSGGVLNMYDGTVDVGWSILDNSTANILGGTLGKNAPDEIWGSTFRVSGGILKSALTADYNSILEISGGSIPDVIRPLIGTVRFTGKSFLVNGGAVPGLAPGSPVTFDKTVAATITGVMLDDHSVTSILDPTFDSHPPGTWDYKVTLMVVPNHPR
jgi:hypothetical protein